MPDFGASVMVDLPTLARTKSLKKATTLAVDSGIPQSDDSGPSTNAAPTADPPNAMPKKPIDPPVLKVMRVDDSIKKIKR